MMIYERCKQGQCQGHWYHRWTHLTPIQMAPPGNWVGSSPPRPGYTVWGRTTPAASLIGSSFCCRGFSSAPLSTQKKKNKQKVTTTIFCWLKKTLVRGLSYCFIHQKSLVISLLQNWNILAHRLLCWVELFPVYPHQKHPFFCLLNRNSVWLQGRSKLCETLRRTQWLNMDSTWL